MNRDGSTLRVGFIGAGFSARLHAEAYHQVRGVDVVLTRVTADRPERAARFAQEFGGGAVTASAEEGLAAPDVDVVDLCVPTATLRAEMLRRALASGDEILAACREAGVRLCYAEHWVFAPPIQRARRLFIAAGGPILRIVGEESQGGT